MSKAFASQADLEDKKITFEQLSPHCWAYTAEGDPNSGVIIGDDFIMVSDATATPAIARDLIQQIRKVSDKPIIVRSRHHAVRVLGASAYFAEGATEIIASQGTLELIRERGAQDMQSEMERFPRLFRGADSVPGLTWPSMVIGGGDAVKGEKPGKLSINLGGVVVQIWSPTRTRVATPSPGWKKKRCCSAATWSNTKPASTPATPSSKSGPPRWKPCARSRPNSSCPAAAKP
jgi:ribosomal protein L14